MSFLGIVIDFAAYFAESTKTEHFFRSMMCLSNAGREAAAAGGDFSQADASPEYLPPHLRRGRMANPPTTKRRTSLSTKWTSEENLGLHGHY